jgi:hypothetical protein
MFILISIEGIYEKNKTKMKIIYYQKKEDGDKYYLDQM